MEKTYLLEFNLCYIYIHVVFVKTCFAIMMDLDRMLSFCQKCKYLPENELKQLCDRICDILISESNIQPVGVII